MNHHRRAAVKQMRLFLRKEGVKKGDVVRFRRWKHSDGTMNLVAILKDERQAAISWQTDPITEAFVNGDGKPWKGGLM